MRFLHARVHSSESLYVRTVNPTDALIIFNVCLDAELICDATQEKFAQVRLAYERFFFYKLAYNL